MAISGATLGNVPQRAANLILRLEQSSVLQQQTKHGSMVLGRR
jgi:hypothetical protein